MFGMRRRDFVVLLGGAAVAWPLAARAQQPAKAPIIGFLGAATASAWRPWTAVFVQRLGHLGWIEGRTVTIEYRWAEGRPERYAEIAAEFVRLKVDVIVTVASAVPALRQATSPSFLRWRMTRLAAAWSRACRDQAVASLDCRIRGSISPANGSNSCARFVPICAVWRS